MTVLRRVALAAILVMGISGVCEGEYEGLDEIHEVVFAVRALGGDGHWYANFGYWCSDSNRMMYGRDGGRLAALNLETGRVRTILEAGDGAVRDPHMHYSGKKMIFSYRKSGSIYYHLYEINVDGTGLRQITGGEFDDIEPVYLPDGGIVFCSSRCNRWVNCWHTQVAVLYRCAADGGNIQILSSNVEQDNTPWVLPDGRVLYMRWEYVDRSRVEFHHLWTMNPDGSGQMVYYGNMHPGTVLLDAKPIPGTDKVVSIFSPGHGRKEHAGHVTVVDVSLGPDDSKLVRRLSNDAECRDPYPVSADCFLIARKNQLLAMDGAGRTKVLYSLGPEEAGYELHEPRVIRGRQRERMVPARTDLQAATGRLLLTDVYRGRNMVGVKRGEIKKLLVLETLPKPVNHSGTMEPLSLGGTFTLPRILGTVPVEADGSAYMEVPALRSLFFVAMDERNMSVKRMQSFTMVMPGETTSCLGCHEGRIQSPANPGHSTTAALQRGPSRITPLTSIPDVYDFPRDIQPILDKHCVKCHNYEKYLAGVVLTGDRGPIYSHAYTTLLSRTGLVSHGRDARGNQPPRGIGSSASRLMQKIDGSHNEVKVSSHERDLVRYWIESGAPYAGTYAALGTGMVQPKLNGDAWQRRCASCHKQQDGERIELKYNLSRPEKSLLLLGPLAKEAGGYGLCRPKKKQDGEVAFVVFAGTSDPDYQALLSEVRQAKKQLDDHKRFDMPDFRPSRHYVREMTKYGLLEAGHATDLPVDVYAVDRAYWRSHWHKGNADSPNKEY